MSAPQIKSPQQASSLSQSPCPAGHLNSELQQAKLSVSASHFGMQQSNLESPHPESIVLQLSVPHVNGPSLESPKHSESASQSPSPILQEPFLQQAQSPSVEVQPE